MKKTTTLFCWGLLISLAGTLPPGIFTLTASQIASTGDHTAAWQFSMGAMLGEVVVVRLALGGMQWFSRNKKFIRLLEWMSIGLLVLFALACFITALQEQDFSSVTGKIASASFLTGFSLSLINPVHIPFWMGWTLVLLKKDVLRLTAGNFNWFSTGIGMGTVAGFWIFIDAGSYLLALFHANQFWIQCGLGLLLLWVAAVQIRKQIAVQPNRVYSR